MSAAAGSKATQAPMCTATKRLPPLLLLLLLLLVLDVEGLAALWFNPSQGQCSCRAQRRCCRPHCPTC